MLRQKGDKCRDRQGLPYPAGEHATADEVGQDDHTGTQRDREQSHGGQRAAAKPVYRHLQEIVERRLPVFVGQPLDRKGRVELGADDLAQVGLIPIARLDDG